MSTDAQDAPALQFRPEALARPTGDIVDAMIVAVWEARHAPRDLRIRGALHAGQWLGQARRYGPVSGEDRAPGARAVVDEYDQARAVFYGLPHAARHTATDYALGVAQMLSYAIDTDAPQPVRLVHAARPPRAA